MSLKSSRCWGNEIPIRRNLCWSQQHIFDCVSNSLKLSIKLYWFLLCFCFGLLRGNYGEIAFHIVKAESALTFLFARDVSGRRHQLVTFLAMFQCKRYTSATRKWEQKQRIPPSNELNGAGGGSGLDNKIIIAQNTNTVPKAPAKKVFRIQFMTLCQPYALSTMHRFNEWTGTNFVVVFSSLFKYPMVKQRFEALIPICCATNSNSHEHFVLVRIFRGARHLLSKHVSMHFAAAARADKWMQWPFDLLRP